MGIVKWIDEYMNRALSKQSAPIGRIVIVVMLGVYFGLLFGLSHIRHTPYYKLWPRLGVPATPFSHQGLTTNSFGDLRSVLSCYDCTRLGYDVMIVNPCNPNQTGLGATPYPRIWWSLTPLGLSQRHTIVLGLLLIGAFYAAILLLAGRLSTGEGVVYGLFLCSPPLMLLVERCNVDIVLFLMLIAALFISSWGRTAAIRSLAYGLILIAAIFKLYPIAGLILALKEKRSACLIFTSLVVGLFAIYFVSHLAEMRTLKAIVADTDYLSYGYKIIFYRISEVFHTDGQDSFHQIFRIVRGSVLVLLFVTSMAFLIGQALFALRGWIARPYTPVDTNDTDTGTGQAAFRLDGFRLGAGLYLLTFGLGSVFSYKLVFVLFALPQMMAWIRLRGPFSSYSSAGLVGMLAMFYMIHFSKINLDQIVSWLLAGYFVCGIFLTLPNWLKGAIHHAIARQPRLGASEERTS